jgi:CO/xanthine dehydrogenase FAD-binding subunit
MTTVEMEPITDWHRPLRDTDFYTAHSVDEALGLVEEHPGARFIAGGTTLVRMERWGGHLPPALIYIGRIAELKEIREQDGRVLLGSLVVHGQLRRQPTLRERARLLLLAAREIAGPAVRNLATIGGNVYINWDLVPPLMALDARVQIRDRGGEQEIPLAEFYDDAGQPKIGPTQLIVGISVATDLPRSDYQKVARRRAVSRAIAGAGVTMDLDGDVCREVRIGIGGAGLRSRRLFDAEDVLRGRALSDDLVGKAGEVAYESAADAFEDYEAAPWYTREMARVTTERAINGAAGRPVV